MTRTGRGTAAPACVVRALPGIEHPLRVVHGVLNWQGRRDGHRLAFDGREKDCAVRRVPDPHLDPKALHAQLRLDLAICEAISRTLLATDAPDLAARLRWLRLRGRPGESRDGGALHTMHGAKGLEFTQVALLGVDDATIPGDPRRHAAEVDTNSVTSERRLLYVAMTRARDGLVIAHTAGKGSRFLGELPDGLPSVG